MIREELFEKLSKKNIDIYYELLKEKNYDKIYELFGKNIYLFSASPKHKSQDIKRLMQEKNYSELINKYGSLDLLFVRGFKKQNKEHKKELLEQGNFEQFYQEYGETESNKNMPKIMKKDVQNEIGKKISFKLIKEKIRIKAKKDIKNAMEFTATMSAASLVLVSIYTSSFVKDVTQNEITYYKELQAYNNSMYQYAEEVKEENLTDVEIIMKLMNDMWSNNYYKATDTMDITGLLRLDLSENGYGVCRHMADDFAAKANAINPEYNARSIAVKISNLESLANIDRKIVETNETVDENEQNKENEEESSITNYFGNHAVVLLDVNINNKKITLVVDPTNPSIGYLKDSQIKMLSAKYGNGLEYKPFGQLFLDPDKILDIRRSEVESYLTNIDEQIIENEFGLNAQNEAKERLNNKG